MSHYVIYDGNCNLCVTLVKLLESLDQGKLFTYLPMQDAGGLGKLGLTAADCEMGMILVDATTPSRRWQGSAAAEEIGQRLPLGHLFVSAYRALPGVKWSGDRVYEHVRDHRYTLFGRRATTYQPQYPACVTEGCKL